MAPMYIESYTRDVGKILCSPQVGTFLVSLKFHCRKLTEQINRRAGFKSAY